MANSADLEIELPPRLRLSRIPTPIEMLQWLPPQAARGDVEIFIKRDDLTGGALAGNKVRKLDYLLADAVAQECDTIITCGDVQSNHCRATTLAAARFGLATHLLLRGQPSASPDGNLFMDLLAGASVEYITPEQYGDRDALLAACADTLKAAGRRPYVIPEGGSNPLGCFGYINCAREIAYQSDRLGYRFSHIVCATSSAGTQCGLIIGAQAYLRDVKVIGISVASPADRMRSRIVQLLELWSKEFQPGAPLPYEAVEVLDGYAGPGYGLNVPEDLAMIRTMARNQGLLLDPVYTVKAFRGMCDEVSHGRFPPGSSILFVHTGGMLGLFPRRDELLQTNQYGAAGAVLQEVPQ